MEIYVTKNSLISIFYHFSGFQSRFDHWFYPYHSFK